MRRLGGATAAVVAVLVLVGPALAQQPSAPGGHQPGGQAQPGGQQRDQHADHHSQHHGPGGMMGPGMMGPGMMGPGMMGGGTMPMGLCRMSGGTPDPVMLQMCGELLKARGDMLRQMGDIMMKYGKQLSAPSR